MLKKFISVIFLLLTSLVFAQTPVPTIVGDVAFDGKWEHVMGPVTFTAPKNPEDEAEIFNFYKVGRFVAGKYKGYDFVTAGAVYDGPCKGPGCFGLSFCRFARKDQHWVYFPSISKNEVVQNFAVYEKFYGNTQQNLDTDGWFNLPLFDYPKTLVGPGPRQELKFFEEWKCSE